MAVDWLKDEGHAVVDGIVKEGGKAVFVEGDISETAVCDAMVMAAVDNTAASTAPSTMPA